MGKTASIEVNLRTNESLAEQIRQQAPGLTPEQVAARMNAAIAVGAQGPCIGVRRTETPERIIVKVPHNSLSK